MHSALRVLSLEDDPIDAELVRETLASDGIPCDITRVDTEADFIASLDERGYDLILADYTLPAFDGLSALKIARQRWPSVPFIFVSGTLDEEIAIEALKVGATDYVFKTRLSRIVPSVRRALLEAEERRERRRAAEALRRSEAYLSEAQRFSHTGSFGWDLSSGEIYWSLETFRIFGYDTSSKVTIQLVVERSHPEDRAAVQQFIERVSREREDFDFEHRLWMPDGSVKYVRAVGHPSENERGNFEFVGAVTDITERKRTESLLAGEKRLLEMVARGDPLSSILNALCQLGEELVVGALVSILLVSADAKSLSHGAAPSLPSRYTESIDGGLIGPRAGSCGTAAYRKEPVIVSDIETDPLWADYRHLALPEGLRACWSTPIFSTNRKVLGTFAVYCREPGSPTPEQRSVVEQFVQMASIAIERSRAQEERERAEADLQKALDEIKSLRDQLYKENIALREEIDKASMFEEIVGDSAGLQTVLSLVAKVAPTDSTVLVTGETGTGKELVARAIHKRSQRSARTFVSVNCAAIPQALIASELFGHEKGAFTGALQRRLGRFELAEGGTIFLDEIGELPAETQIALLRVLQEKEFERIGGSQPIHADVRVIAATNRDLEGAVEQGAFRKDLFYRLNVFPIEIPALRQRKEDIPTLAEYFIRRYSKKAGKKITNIAKGAMELLQSYSWPGNIRELQNLVERSVIVCETDSFSVDPRWLSVDSSSTDKEGWQLRRKSPAQEKEVIEAALAATRGRVSGPAGAASQLGMPASTLESKIRSLRINKYRFKRL